MVKAPSQSTASSINNSAIFHKTDRFSQLISFDENEASDLYIVSNIRENAVLFARMAGVKPDDLDDIQIALGEALSNAIRHGSPVLGVSRIGLGCKIANGQFVAVVTDQGQPFDSRLIHEPCLDECPECGMGVYLMRLVMDAVEFSHSNFGNRVRLVKNLAASI